MKQVYRGCEIEVYSDSDYLYYSAYSKDGYCITETYTEGRDTIKDIVRHLKQDVDEYLNKLNQ